jgi:hypothetical protein
MIPGMVIFISGGGTYGVEVTSPGKTSITILILIHLVKHDTYLKHNHNPTIFTTQVW